jgi:hypothetical protein
MNILTKLFKKAVELDTNIGKTIICFSTHGCQGTIHEFEYIGVITDIEYSKSVHSSINVTGKIYIVSVIKSKSGEKRDGLMKFEKVVKSEIQYIEGVLITYK